MHKDNFLNGMYAANRERGKEQQCIRVKKIHIVLTRKNPTKYLYQKKNRPSLFIVSRERPSK